MKAIHNLLAGIFIVVAVLLFCAVATHTNFLSWLTTAPFNTAHPSIPALPGQHQAHSTALPDALTGPCFTVARSAAAQHAIDPVLYVRQINQESGCKDVTSPAGAQGYAQLMPAMVAFLHVDPHNMLASLNAGARLMSDYLKAHAGSWPIALACYNAGTGATAQALQYGSSWLAHLPTETQRYISAIV